MTNIAEVESLNYDFLPGEPYSQRVWFITLKRPLHLYTLSIGMFLRFYTAHHSNSIVPDNRIFQVEDLHGRHIVVIPISDLNGLAGDMRLIRVEHHSNMEDNEPHLYRDGSYHPRMGSNLSASRIHKASYITYPISPIFINRSTMNR